MINRTLHILSIRNKNKSTPINKIKKAIEAKNACSFVSMPNFPDIQKIKQAYKKNINKGILITINSSNFLFIIFFIAYFI